jgi:REP element-mobilizing transposase RayT
VTSRGHERREVVRDDVDRERWLRILADVVVLFTWRLDGYVLMGNHDHLDRRDPTPSLSRGMRHLNGVYTQAFNRRHERVGHLFQGRFKAILVEKESHLLELLRYVVLNPVRAGLVLAAGVAVEQLPRHRRGSAGPALAGNGVEPRAVRRLSRSSGSPVPRVRG